MLIGRTHDVDEGADGGHLIFALAAVDAPVTQLVDVDTARLRAPAARSATRHAAGGPTTQGLASCTRPAQSQTILQHAS